MRRAASVSAALALLPRPGAGTGAPYACSTSAGETTDAPTIGTTMVNGAGQCCDVCSARADCAAAVLGPAKGPNYYPCDFKGSAGTPAKAADHSVITPTSPPGPPPPSTPPPGPPTPVPPPPPPMTSKRLVPPDGSVMHCAGQMNDGMTITDQIPYPGVFTGFTGDNNGPGGSWNNGTDTCPGTDSCDKTCGNCGMCGCYHCCGGFSSYSAYLEPATRPMMFMVYYAPTWPAENYAPWFAKLKEHLGRYPAEQYVGIQMALWTTGMDDKIVNGTYDQQLDNLIEGFKSVGRPVWLRIGYEFNGPWNQHEPEGYVASWKYITAKLRADAWCNKWVATVWDYSADAPSPKGKMEYAWSYYPGDEWVDWAAVNLFSGCAAPMANCPGEDAASFIKLAEARNLPIMFGESTPRQGAGSTQWYADYFAAVRSSPNVRAACYINWNWFPSNWGDTRIEHSPSVGTMYQAELKKEENNFFHATTREATLKRLGLA